MMTDRLTEEFTLPSRGLVYNTKFDPTITLRPMTLADEMKRLSPTKNTYKRMAEIIDGCLTNKLPISAYDLCVGDYIYLLQALRITTYGPEYKFQFTCPFCDNSSTDSIDLDKMSLNEYTSEFETAKYITLPVSGKEVELRLQTPRDLDNIARKAREEKTKYNMDVDQELSYTIESYINTIDGETLDPVLGREALKKLSMKDTNYLIQSAEKLNSMIGINSIILLHCDNCGRDIPSPFRYTEEFFRPSID